MGGMLIVMLALLPAQAPAVTVVTDEAEAALAILEVRKAGREPGPELWQRLFASEGYRRLAAREQAIGRPMTDSAFAAFLQADSMAARAPLLRATVSDWKRADLSASLGRALAYLPRGTAIRARIYLLIKPKSNSFVFETTTNPAIMLFVDPAVPRNKLENTMAHELHHLGYARACPEEPAGDHPSPAARARHWISAFGEGLAMLAAAGGPGIHPHATSDSADRIRWDRDIDRVATGFAGLERFLGDVVEERVTDADSIQTAAMSFFGEQGPWYTVGWTMARTIEAADGRAALLAVICRPAELMTRYNDAAGRLRPAAPLPRWSEGLLRRLAAPD